MADQKRTDGLDWEDLKFFTALARRGTLSATARALRVNHATVSRRITALEAILGASLFDRRADGYVLTAMGRILAEELQPMEAAALAALRRLDQGTPSQGLVRLTTTRPLADLFLTERLAPFQQRWPQIEIELLGDARDLSLARREADMALRFGDPKDSDLTGRLLATAGHDFYVAPSWRERVAAGETPPLISFDVGSAELPIVQWQARHLAGRTVAFRSNSWWAQAAAARAGVGAALLPRWLAGLSTGLISLPLGPTPPQQALWLLIRPDLTETPRVRALADFLIQLIERHRRLFEIGIL